MALDPAWNTSRTMTFSGTPADGYAHATGETNGSGSELGAAVRVAAVPVAAVPVAAVPVVAVPVVVGTAGAVAVGEAVAPEAERPTCDGAHPTRTTAAASRARYAFMSAQTPVSTR